MLLQDDVAAQQCAARQLEWRGYRDGFYISTVGDVANHGDVESVIGEVQFAARFRCSVSDTFLGCPFSVTDSVSVSEAFRFRFGSVSVSVSEHRCASIPFRKRSVSVSVIDVFPDHAR